MQNDAKSDRITTFSLGALAGVFVAIFAVLFQRWRQTSARVEANGPAEVARQACRPAAQSSAPLTTGAGKKPHPVQPGTAPQTEMEVMTSTSWTTPTKYIVSVILFLAALLIAYIGRRVIPMVITAAVLSLFINPLINYLNRRMSWGKAVGVTYLLVGLALAAGLLLVIPSVLDTINLIIEFDYRGLAGDIASGLQQFAAGMQTSPVLSATFGPLLENIIKTLENFARQAQLPLPGMEITLASLIPQLAGTLVTLANIFGPVVSLLVSILITLLISVQMSLAAKHISGWYPDLVPTAYKPEYGTLMDEISRTWTSFLRGELTLMLIIGVTTTLGNALLGVRQALFLGILAGLFELIPNVGPTLAAIPAVLLALFFGSSHFAINNVIFALLVLGLYVLIQFIENQFLVPYIMGDAVNLPPVIVLIGTIAGAMAFGVLGALLATPVIATGNLIFRYVYRKILEPPPLPAEPEQKPSYWDSFKRWTRGILKPGRRESQS
jgi:predicted PurR-regulated permease PerM